jgi:hypothetical protein
MIAVKLESTISGLAISLSFAEGSGIVARAAEVVRAEPAGRDKGRGPGAVLDFGVGGPSLPRTGTGDRYDGVTKTNV